MVLFIGSQMASTLVMSVTADKTQQRIMLLLPLVFAALIPNFPAGLIVYWITTNFWTLGQQLVVRRLVAAAAGRAARAARGACTDGKGVAAGSRRRRRRWQAGRRPPPRSRRRRRARRSAGGD